MQQLLGFLGCSLCFVHRFAQLLHHAMGQLAQCVEPPDLAYAQQRLGAMAVVALAQECTRRQQHQRYSQAPRRHAGQPQLTPADVALCDQAERLCAGAQRLQRFKGPATRRVGARLHRFAFLQHHHLRLQRQGYTHGAGVARHRPVLPRNHGFDVHQQGEARSLLRQNQVIAALGQVHIGQHRAFEAA